MQPVAADEHPSPTQSPLEQLDFVYLPSADVAADLRYFTEVLGPGRSSPWKAWAREWPWWSSPTGPPRLLLAGHLEGERPDPHLPRGRP